MSISAIKQGYIVKYVLFLSLLCIISLGLIGGCSDNNSGIKATALTENDFAEDSSLRADLEEGVVVTFLEAPNSEAPENDTGTLGEDDIPVTYKETVEQTFCWEDKDADAMHFMELRDSQGSLILTVQVNGDCVTEVIEAGDYVIAIYHDETIGDALPIFLIPNPVELEQARETEGIIGRFKLVASNILKRIDSTVSADAQAQTQAVMDNTNTLLSTNSCVECNLSRANLRFANLKGADLRNARLTYADLRDSVLIDADLRGARMGSIVAFADGADLNRADLTGADLRNARMQRAILLNTVLIGANLSGAQCARADFDGADLTDAVLHDADLRLAFLTGADFLRADLQRADLSEAILLRSTFFGADLRDVDLRDAILTTANFASALWCDGLCVCGALGSIGTCNGCAPVEEVCTGP